MHACAHAYQGQVNECQQLCHVEVLLVILHEETHWTVATAENYSQLLAYKLTMLFCR